MALIPRPAPEPSDAAIIAESLTHPQAFSAIFDRHFDAIHGYLARRWGADRADDLSAATFTVAFERRASFRERADARPWLYGIATNLLRNEWRAERRALAAVSALAREPVFGGELAAGDDGDPTLLTALAALDSDQRDVLLLHAWEDLGYREIAAALEIPIGTVRSRLARARSRLRRELTRTPNRPTEVTG